MAQGILDELREEVLTLRKLVEEKTIKLEQDIGKLKEELEELKEFKYREEHAWDSLIKSY